MKNIHRMDSSSEKSTLLFHPAPLALALAFRLAVAIGSIFAQL